MVFHEVRPVATGPPGLRLVFDALSGNLDEIHLDAELVPEFLVRVTDVGRIGTARPDGQLFRLDRGRAVGTHSAARTTTGVVGCARREGESDDCGDHRCTRGKLHCFSLVLGLALTAKAY